MPQIINIILTTIAPIILIAGLGALLDRTKAIDARTISQVAIYLTSPALAFSGIANASLDSREFGGLILYSILLTSVISLLAWLVSLWLKMDRLTSSAFVLSATLMNTANLGIPLNEFTFGQPGLERAVVISMLGGLYTNTVGIFLASWGRASVARALRNVFIVPLPYAALLGLMVNLYQWPVPNLMLRLTGILGSAAVPLMLIMLGVQISRVSFQGQWPIILGASSIRLLAGPVVGALAAGLLGLQGVTRQVAIIEAATPSAVTAAILATEFNSDARLASSIVLVSTLLSLITIPVVILYVGL